MPDLETLRISSETARQCRELVYEKASLYRVPPAHVVAHIPTVSACRARHEVWRVMIEEMGLRRWQVAKMFGRDLRRLRASVLQEFSSRYVPMVVVENQLYWGWTSIPKPEPIRKQVNPATLFKEIPDDAVSHLSDHERLMLKRALKRQLAKLS